MSFLGIRRLCKVYQIPMGVSYTQYMLTTTRKDAPPPAAALSAAPYTLHPAPLTLHRRRTAIRSRPRVPVMTSSSSASQALRACFGVGVGAYV